jgi:hypothetical protein
MYHTNENFQILRTVFVLEPELDTQEFRRLVEAHEWQEAADILNQYTNTDEDTQDWISNGDWSDITSRTIEELAAEFDAYCEGE